MSSIDSLESKMRIGCDERPTGRHCQQEGYSDFYFSKLSAILQQELRLITDVERIDVAPQSGCMIVQATSFQGVVHGGGDVASTRNTRLYRTNSQKKRI